MTHVWYCSYGSNMCPGRFMCYLKGGKVKGMNRACPGARDPTLPLGDKAVLCSHPLYFARMSRTWKGGPAFVYARPSQLKPASGNEKRLVEANATEHNDGWTRARMYKITLEQFVDVVAQENVTTAAQCTFDVDAVCKQGFYDLPCGGWYSRLLYLGDNGGCPVFTFTDPKGEEKHTQPTTPSAAYVSVISAGISDCHTLSLEENAAYFQERIRSESPSFDESELLEVVTAAVKVLKEGGFDRLPIRDGDDVAKGTGQRTCLGI